MQINDLTGHYDKNSTVSKGRGVATGWTGVDMSTPLLPEVVPEIDANLVSFYGEGESGQV